MIIGFDIDGVWSEFAIGFSLLMHQLYGLPLVSDEDQIKSWDWSEWYPATKEQKNKAWAYIRNSYNWWESLPLVNDLKGIEVAREYITKTVKINQFPFITTRIATRGSSVADQSSSWLHRVAGLPKGMTVINSKKKGDVCKSLGVQYFIDDKPENIENILEVCNGSCKCVLRDRTHNKGALPNVPRVDSLGGYIEYILNDIKTNGTTNSNEL